MTELRSASSTGNRVYTISCIFFITIFNLSWSSTRISGNMTGQFFATNKGPFIVENDIVIPSDQQVIINEGTVFLFCPFTGLDIQGDIVIKGTEKKPVVFTSISDAAYNDTASQLPKSFDWNGITINNGDKKAELRHFQVKYSVYGIKTKNEALVISNGIFESNGQFHVTVQEKILDVKDDAPFYYNADTVKVNPKAGPDSVVIVKSPKNAKKIVGALLGGIGLAATGVGIYYAYESSQSWDKHASYDELDQANKPYIDRYYQEYEDNRRLSIIFFSSSGTLLCGGITLFIFDNLREAIHKNRDNKKSKTTITISALPFNQSYYAGIRHTF